MIKTCFVDLHWCIKMAIGAPAQAVMNTQSRVGVEQSANRDAESRDAWRAGLIDYFGAVRGELSEDSQERLEQTRHQLVEHQWCVGDGQTNAVL